MPRGSHSDPVVALVLSLGACLPEHEPPPTPQADPASGGLADQGGT